MSISPLDLVIIALVATFAAVLLCIMLHRISIDQKATRITDNAMTHGPVFLFQNEILIDATADALSLIAPHNNRMSDFDAAMHVLGAHFPDLRRTLEQHEDGKQHVDSKKQDSLCIAIDRSDENLRLTITNSKEMPNVVDLIQRDVRLSELNMLRELTQHTPQLIWQENKNGRLIWANHAYMNFSDTLSSQPAQNQPTWPSNPVFTDLHETAPIKGQSVRRLAVTLPEKKAEHWFDVTSVKQEDGYLHFAADANAAVRADQERRNFVQTLGKTFAHLSIGLAIFDKRRQLAMFNPALLELTSLSATFLSSRPTIDAVLDRLRESRMLPEPKDYTSWREQFTALEVEAKEGTYCQNWNIPDGQTFRVTGRPHPDGAFAFLFEDITAEVSLTRGFRSDIETGQAVLDTLTDAIAVFSSAGALVMSNRAYAGLWQSQQSDYLDQREFQTEIQIWQNRCTPTQMWSEMQDFVHLLDVRKPWSDSAILDDGRHIQCHANPIAGGMTMVRFTFTPPKKPIIQKLTMPDPAILSARR